MRNIVLYRVAHYCAISYNTYMLSFKPNLKLEKELKKLESLLIEKYNKTEELKPEEIVDTAEILKIRTGIKKLRDIANGNIKFEWPKVK